jgi:hypothetical protein
MTIEEALDKLKASDKRIFREEVPRGVVLSRLKFGAGYDKLYPKYQF